MNFQRWIASQHEKRDKLSADSMNVWFVALGAFHSWVIQPVDSNQKICHKICSLMMALPDREATCAFIDFLRPGFRYLAASESPIEIRLNNLSKHGDRFIVRYQFALGLLRISRSSFKLRTFVSLRKIESIESNRLPWCMHLWYGQRRIRAPSWVVHDWAGSSFRCGTCQRRRARQSGPPATSKTRVFLHWFRTLQKWLS